MSTDKSQNSSQKKPPDNSQWMRYASMGTQIFATILIFVFAGYKIDGWLHLKFPAFTLTLSLIGVAAGIYFAVKDLLKK
jgi:F0F1-type ATP synthase assembly protein I